MDALLKTKPVQGIDGRADTTRLSAAANVPANLLDALLPGYSVISRFFKDFFAVDISIFVGTPAILYAFYKAASYTWLNIRLWFERHLTSSIHIDDDDDLYHTVVRWIADQRMTKRSRAVKACSVRGSAFDEDAIEKQAAMSALDSDGTFNYSMWEARVPPQYEPYYGTYRFFHKRRLFSFRREVRQTKTPQMSFYGNDRESEILELSCVGRSTQPIKDLLLEIKIWSVNKQYSRTIIRHANTKNSRSGRGGWSRTTSRPSRPMNTVVLDDVEKMAVQHDMNEFLHPATPRWYALRGIPYRRGYLFHGPPGTGKTSLSFALAGKFGLDIYCIALNDPELSETDLRDLFNNLPRRCIVLLEDIDEAGVKRDKKDDDSSDSQSAAKVDTYTGLTGEQPVFETLNSEPSGSIPSENKVSATEISVANGHANEEATGESKIPVEESPSTTANGVGPTDTDPDKIAADKTTNARPDGQKSTSEQGSSAKTQDKAQEPPMETNWTLQDLARALIGVTNESELANRGNRRWRHTARSSRNKHDDDLDANKSGSENGISLSGLLNAIDGVATHEGRVLIMTTNHPERLDAALIRAGRVDLQVRFTYATKAQIRDLFLRMYSADINAADERSAKTMEEEEEEKAALEDLEGLAGRFAEKLPDMVFSPSEIQGYLLKHKKAPEGALEEVQGWVEGQMKKRKGAEHVESRTV